MKKRLGLFFVIMFALTLLPVSAILADDTMTTDSNQTTSSEPTEAEDKFEISDTKAADYQKKLEERLTARKEVLKTKLTTAQQKRVATRCKAAQALITKVSDRAGEAKTNRDQIYTKILTSATTLRDKLKANGKDTTKLDTNITELEALVTTFKTDLQDLRQAAADVTGMDCAKDPSSFKASLEALKTAREAVVKDSLAIRTYINEQLKPTLKEIRTSIGEAKEEGMN